MELKQIDICDEMSQNFIDYSYETNSQRAFPDARDGLKPGQRACLWEYYTQGYTSNKPHVKSAKVSGGVISNWHPHGDTAVYETFVRMSQTWINNIPEVDWHGSNGNIVIGAEAASARYTETRLSKASELGFFQGIKKNNVPMRLNFSEDKEMPVVLPAIFPRLAVNGSMGIGVSIAQNWIPMNLKEITNVIINYVRTKEFEVNAPLIDFPSGGIIINGKDLPIIFKTGKGKVVLRAKTEIKNNSILITELPYQVYVEPLLDEIKKLIQANEYPEIKEIFNKTDKKRLLVEIECSSDPERVLQRLFKDTSLQKNYNANQVALVSKTPELLNLQRYIDIYLEHNTACIKKEYEFDIQKAKSRLELLEGYLKILEDIDNVIVLIKQSENEKDAQSNLIKKYSLSERQAKAITDMKLGKLTKLSKVELETEKKGLEAEIEEKTLIINSKDKLEEVLIERLSDFTKKFGKDRKTEICDIDLTKKKEKEYIPAEDVCIIVTEDYYIKREKPLNKKSQSKGGVGFKNKDNRIYSFFTTTADTLLLYTSKGMVYKYEVNKIPESKRGIPVSEIIPQGEKILTISTEEENKNYKYLVTIASNNYIKKTALEDCIPKRNSLSIAKLDEGETLKKVFLANDHADILLTSSIGNILRLSLDSIKAIGRTAKGIKGFKFSDDTTKLINAVLLRNYANEVLLCYSVNKIKVIKKDSFTVHLNNTKGQKYFKEEIGKFISVNYNSDLLLIGKPNSIIIRVKDISSQASTPIKNSIISDVIEIKK